MPSFVDAFQGGQLRAVSIPSTQRSLGFTCNAFRVAGIPFDQTASFLDGASNAEALDHVDDSRSSSPKLKRMFQWSRREKSEKDADKSTKSSKMTRSITVTSPMADAVTFNTFATEFRLFVDSVGWSLFFGLLLSF